jgi:general secretion pathway protein K
MNNYLIIARAWLIKGRLNERGMALLLTLLVTVILAVVVLEFNYLMRVHASLSGNLVDELRARAAAEAGIETARAILLNDIVVDSKDGFFSDSLDEDWVSEIEMKTDSSEMEAIISDEMSKLNLNRLLSRAVTGAGNETVNIYMVENLRRLFESLNLEPNLVHGIVDWIDENNDEETFGAENSHYESLDPPIRCKNGALDSIEELLLIEGFDEEIIYGDGDVLGLREYVTICGDEKGLVNINTASEEVIAAVLNDDSLASTIVEMRETLPFKDEQDMTERLIDVDLKNGFTTQSSCFQVSSSARVLSGDLPIREVKLKALFRRSLDQKNPREQSFSVDTVSWKVER